MKRLRLPASAKLSLAPLSSAVLYLCVPGAISAQDQGLEEITVTGSRIVRRDFEANSPILTVEEQAFDNTMSIGIETVMNQLPQFVPAVTPFTTTDVQASATNTPGASTLSLRGLGANRNLVLIDGRRGMPVNALGAVSINSIPSAAVQRVETITGGASSVYGADAMAGVVNFILKKDYEGVDFDVRYGETAEGDGEEMRVSGVYGANFADDAGNVLMGFEYSSRGRVRSRDREWQRAIWEDPSVGNNFFAPTETAYVVEATSPPTPGVANGLMPCRTTANVSVAGNQQFFVNLDATNPASQGSLWKFTPDGSRCFNGSMGDNVMLRKYRIDNEQQQPIPPANTTAGTLVEQDTTGMLEIPLDRYALFGSGRLEVSDNVSAIVQVNFSEDETDTQLGDNYLGSFWGAYVPHGTGIYAPSVGAGGNTLPAYLAGGIYGLNCAPTGGCTNSQVWPTAPALTQLLDSRRLDPDGAGPAPAGATGSAANAPWSMASFTTYAGKRTTDNDVQTYQFLAGFEGELANRDMTWEAYLSHGSTDVSTIFGGVISIERYRYLVNLPNYGRNAFDQGNDFSAAHIAGGTLECTTGLPIAESFTPSQDCVDAIVADLQSTSEMDQTIAELNVQGKLVDLWAGEARFAAGVSTRENSYFYIQDPLASQTSFLDGAVGIFPGGNSAGETSTNEIYGELLLPLMSDLGVFDAFSLELGYRYSDNDPTEAVETYKAMFDWRVNDHLRLRGGRNIANRAPNIGELFEAKTQIVGAGGSTLGDLCNPTNTAGGGLSANPGLNPNAAQVRAMCEAQMGVTGATAYYAPGNNPGASTLGNRTGNPNLHSEGGETMTIGAVLNFADRTSITVDAYQITITDYIAAQLGESVFRTCYDPAFNPTYSPFTAACEQILRDPSNGQIGAVDVTYSNSSSVETSGIDLQFDWGMDLAGGNLGLNFLASYLDSMKTKLAPTAAWSEWKGTFGPAGLSGLNPGAFDYRTFTTVSFFKSAWNLSLRWRHLPTIKPSAVVSNPATTTINTPSYDAFDLSGGFTFQDSWQLRYGIDNLFDEQPVFTNATRFTRGTATNGGFYDVLGRRAYVGLSVSF
jgi:iron complex outermembrane receptor protein